MKATLCALALLLISGLGVGSAHATDAWLSTDLTLSAARGNGRHARLGADVELLLGDEADGQGGVPLRFGPFLGYDDDLDGNNHAFSAGGSVLLWGEWSKGDWIGTGVVLSAGALIDVDDATGHHGGFLVRATFETITPDLPYQVRVGVFTEYRAESSSGTSRFLVGLVVNPIAPAALGVGALLDESASD